MLEFSIVLEAMPIFIPVYNLWESVEEVPFTRIVKFKLSE